MLKQTSFDDVLQVILREIGNLGKIKLNSIAVVSAPLKRLFIK